MECTLRRAGAAIAEREMAKSKEMGHDAVGQFQLALRVELDRQTKKLEDLLEKQAAGSQQEAAEHRQEVKGISEAWQLVARTLGEQLSSVHSLQKKSQETCKRIERSLLEFNESSDKEMKKMGDQICEELKGFQRQPYGRPQVHQLPMSGESSPTAAKVGDSSPRPQMCQLQLPNAISEEQPALSPRSPASTPPASPKVSRQQRRRDRTLKMMRPSEPMVSEEQTFAALQKQYGIRPPKAPTEPVQKSWLRKCCIEIVSHKRFEMGCALLVILCAASIGIESDYTIQNASAEQHIVFRALDISFNILFALELMVRWTAEGPLMFLSCENPAWKWNWMDVGLASSSLVEELATFLATASFLDVSALRMLRMMRLVRVARIIRMLRFFSELRVMVNGIMGSAKPLLWAFVFLLILMFMVGVTFMQLAANYLSQTETTDELLLLYWGSLSRTMMTLYMAISGGVDWKDSVQPLRAVSEALEYMFATYVFFTLFCCLNIVTGIFVDNAKALKSADEDAMYLEALTERRRWVAEVKDLFLRLDSSINGKFTFEDFKLHVSNIKVQTLFRKLGINIDNIETEELWEILDADHSGEIDEEEFAKGLKYFQGPAQSIHVYRLMKESQRLHDKVEDLQRALGFDYRTSVTEAG